MSIKLYRIFFVISLIFLLTFSVPFAYAASPPDAAHSSLTADEVPADGTTTSNIIVTLQDSSGNPLEGDTVQLSNSSDSSIKFSPSSATLDASGSATFTAVSNNPGTDPINVTDTTTSTTLTALGQVVFDVPPTPASPSTTCSAVAPVEAPNLYQVVAVNNSATVYFSPPSSSYDGFTISYGKDSNADAYNATLSEGTTTGAIKYTVNSLTPDTKYYFKVRANNGCANGPWSSVLSSSGNSTPPTTGPSNIMYFGLAAALMSFGGFGVFLKFK
jgi:hypothetical protein